VCTLGLVSASAQHLAPRAPYISARPRRVDVRVRRLSAYTHAHGSGGGGEGHARPAGARRAIGHTPRPLRPLIVGEPHDTGRRRTWDGLELMTGEHTAISRFSSTFWPMGVCARSADMGSSGTLKYYYGTPLQSEAQPEPRFRCAISVAQQFAPKVA